MVVLARIKYFITHDYALTSKCLFFYVSGNNMYNVTTYN